MRANILGTVAALFTGQANSIGPALATEVKKVPDPIHIQIQFVRPPSPPPSSDPRWLSQLMIVRSFPQSDLDRFGNPQRYRAGIIVRRLWRKSENICPAFRVDRKERSQSLVDGAIRGDGVMAIDHCSDGGRPPDGGQQFSEFRFAPDGRY